MVKPDTWMPFYVADYLADTTHLNTQQHGAYCLLLLAGWRNGGRLPSDDEQLALITRLPLATWLKHKAVILKFFQIDGDEIYQGRMVEEWETATGIIERNRVNGGKGGRPPKQKPKNNPVVSENATQTEPKANPEKTPSPSPSQLHASNEAKDTPLPPSRIAFDQFNVMAKRAGLSVAQAFTKPRERAIDARLRECGGIDGWVAMLEIVERTPYLCGVNDRGWRADLDFVTKQSKFTKIMEGGYGRSDKSTGNRDGFRNGFFAVALGEDSLEPDGGAIPG